MCITVLSPSIFLVLLPLCARCFEFTSAAFVLFYFVVLCRVTKYLWIEQLYFTQKTPDLFSWMVCEAVKSIRHSCSITSMALYTKCNRVAQLPNANQRPVKRSECLLSRHDAPSITLKTSKTMLITCHLFGSYPWIMSFPFPIYPSTSPPESLSVAHIYLGYHGCTFITPISTVINVHVYTIFHWFSIYSTLHFTTPTNKKTTRCKPIDRLRGNQRVQRNDATERDWVMLDYMFCVYVRVIIDWICFSFYFILFSAVFGEKIPKCVSHE